MRSSDIYLPRIRRTQPESDTTRAIVDAMEHGDIHHLIQCLIEEDSIDDDYLIHSGFLTQLMTLLQSPEYSDDALRLIIRVSRDSYHFIEHLVDIGIEKLLIGKGGLYTVVYSLIIPVLMRKNQDYYNTIDLERISDSLIVISLISSTESFEICKNILSRIPMLSIEDSCETLFAIAMRFPDHAKSLFTSPIFQRCFSTINNPCCELIKVLTMDSVPDSVINSIPPKPIVDCVLSMDIDEEKEFYACSLLLKMHVEIDIDEFTAKFNNVVETRPYRMKKMFALLRNKLQRELGG